MLSIVNVKKLNKAKFIFQPPPALLCQVKTSPDTDLRIALPDDVLGGGGRTRKRRDSFVSLPSLALAFQQPSWGPGSHTVVLPRGSGHRSVHLVVGELLGSQLPGRRGCEI